MPIEPDADFQRHLDAIALDGFTLNPPEYERLRQWNYLLANIIVARQNFERFRDHDVELGDLRNSLEQQAFLVAGIMAYCRCYASSGRSIPSLDAKKVYRDTDDGMKIHSRLIDLRNKTAAHTDESDLVHVSIAVKEDSNKIVIRNAQTIKMPTNEVFDFLEAVKHTEHFIIISANKQLNHLSEKAGKPIEIG